MRTALRDISQPKLTFSVVFLVLLALVSAQSATAAQLKEAQITQIVKDVNLLPGQAASRAAVINDNVRDGTAVRTGEDSRTELTFSDQTLARLGANTLFSFNEGTRRLDLGGGAMLLRVPKDAGGATVRTAAVTAAITGTTVLLEYHPKAYIKFISLEGTARLYMKGRLGESVLIKPGQMLVVKPDAKRLPDPVDVDLDRLMKTCVLITDFPPLGSTPLIADEIKHQHDQKVDGDLIDTNLVIVGRGTLVTLVDPTSLDTIDQKTNAVRNLGVGFQPIEVGPLNTITSPDPYIINNTTHFVTAPTITTNGITSVGKFYRGGALDGAPGDYMFGSSSAFDANSGFSEQFVQSINLPLAVFKFTNLQLTGNATITIPPGGATKLALISIGDLTSAPPGGTLTFTGLDTLALFTQNGSINLTAGISFSNIPFLIFYARGATSNLTLASPITGVTSVQLNAEGSVQINAAENVTTFRSDAGVDFLAGTGHVVAQNISITAGNNVNFTTADFAVGVGATTNVFLQAGATANLDIRNDQSVFSNADSLTVMANAVSFTADAGGTTIAFKDLAPIQFAIGAGGIQAPETTFLQASNSMEFTSTGDIVVNSIVGGDIVDSTGGSVHSSGDLVANSIFASGDITSAGDLTGFDSIFAGNIISVTNTLLSPSVTAGGNITAGHIEVQNINPNSVPPSNTTLIAGSGGITPFVGPSGAALQHIFDVMTIQSPKGIDFSGIHFGTASNGGLLTINAESQTFSAAGINGANFNGEDSSGLGNPAGGGGNFTVNTVGNISLNGTTISATTGIIDPTAEPSGAGGTVSLNSGDQLTIQNSTIQVSSSDPVGASNRRSSTTGGNINLSSGATTGVAITITNTAQLLSLLDSVAPGPGGTITILASAPTGNNSQINISGSNVGIIEADGGAIDVRHMGDNGSININNSNMRADIIKIAALGDNGSLSIGGGLINANTVLKLYAPGSNGQINFIASCTLNGGTANIIAANSVTINNIVTVNITGHIADVFAKNANYSGFGGNNSTTGTFGGLGANNPQPLSAAPPLGPPGGP
jgi:mannose-6-phosphate isomerase-like protein (cupin superfamily)